MPEALTLAEGTQLDLDLSFSAGAEPYITALINARKTGAETSVQTIQRVLVEMAINQRLHDVMEGERGEGEDGAPMSEVVGARQMNTWNTEAASLKAEHG